MPETITMDFAFKLAGMFLISSWIGVLIGFVMGRNGAKNGNRHKTREPRFDPGPTEIDERTPYDVALELEEPEEMPRFETLPTELQGE